MQLKTRSDDILYVWDYFFIAHVPAPGDEAVWRAIERATSRIRQCESEFHVSRPPDVRLRGARRAGAAARLALRHIERLSERPEQWTIDALFRIEAFADELMRALASGKTIVLH